MNITNRNVESCMSLTALAMWMTVIKSYGRCDDFLNINLTNYNQTIKANFTEYYSRMPTLEITIMLLE